MKLSMILSIALLTVVGCGKTSQSGNNATTGDSAAQQTSNADDAAAIRGVVDEFTKAYMAKDLNRVTAILATSGNFAFFGTDSTEVLKSSADFQKQMTNDFAAIDSVRMGELRNFSTNISTDKSLGSATFELPFTAVAGGHPMGGTFRFAMTMRKESSGWHLAQGMVAIATVGESSADMVAAMKAGK